MSEAAAKESPQHWYGWSWEPGEFAQMKEEVPTELIPCPYCYSRAKVCHTDSGVARRRFHQERLIARAAYWKALRAGRRQGLDEARRMLAGIL